VDDKGVDPMNDWRDLSAELHVSRSTIFGLWQSGDLASVKIGKRRFSTDRQLADFVERLEAQAGGAA
jgi:hypothetical protein